MAVQNGEPGAGRTWAPVPQREDLENGTSDQNGYPALQVEGAGLLAKPTLDHGGLTLSRAAVYVVVGVVLVLLFTVFGLSLAVVNLSRETITATPALVGGAVLLNGTANATQLNLGLNTAGFPIQLDLSQQACSNNGIWYASTPGCTCFDCYTGEDCSEVVPLASCTVNTESGTPLIYENYWVNHPQQEVRIRASDHIGYMTDSPLPRLEAAIRGVHAMAGNLVTEGRHIVVGAGSSQIIYAAMYGLATANSSSGSAAVYAGTPYYSAYAMQAEVWRTSLYHWSVDKPSPENGTVIEFITQPNNPDGKMNAKTVPGAHGVFDHAYYWPMFSPIDGPRAYGDDDIAVFTLSKLTGHAGTRMGWAFVSDADLAARMNSIMNGQYSYESQARAAVLLEHVLASQGEIMNYGSTLMRGRWDRLQQIFGASSRLACQELEPAAYDTWLGRTRQASPAYLWVHCLDEQRDPDCTATLLSTGIIGRSGPSFGANASYSRIELLMREDTFQKMATKLELLASS